MTDQIIVYVAALTFRRPDFLQELLQAFAALEMPPEKDVVVRFLIVDNDPEGSARGEVESFKATQVEDRVHYVVEPDPGIPAGRNRALQEAIKKGGRFLCFTDDDVRPTRTWLTELVKCQERTNATLLFGPVHCRLWHEVRGLWRKFIATSIIARAKYVAQYAAREASRGRVNAGATSNCLIDLQWTHRRNIRFSQEMRESGGSDTLFRETVRREGGRIEWCERALVYEQLPDNRATLRYQFKRAKAHGMTFERVGRKAEPLILRHPAGRIIAGIGLMAVPVLGKASLILGLQLFGMGVGILQARRGEKSTLYSRQKEP